MGGMSGRIFILLLLSLIVVSDRAWSLDTSARQVILVDHTTNTIMLEKNADSQMAPSSMTKMMTLYLAFSRLRSGDIKWSDRFKISDTAAAMRGSRMFLSAGSQVSVKNLVLGTSVQSGNDAAVALAEGLAGSEANFVASMNAVARKLGMRNTQFRNATGWPDPTHLSTARDILTLARRTLVDFPQYYKYYGQRQFTWAGIKQKNRNPLLHGFKGGDGIKTGHTSLGGYGLAGSARRGERRLVLVINGLPSQQARINEAKRIMEWGFKEFDNFLLFEGGSRIDDAKVWMGEHDQVALRVEQPVLVTMPRTSRPDMKVKVVYREPIPAPIKAGQVVATLSVEAPNFKAVSFPLVAAHDVAAMGVLARMRFALEYLMTGARS